MLVIIILQVKRIIRDVPLRYNIQTERMEKKLTQDELIVKMQIYGSILSRSTLANIKVGIRNIKASDLKIIKEVLNVPYQKFFEKE